MKKAGEALVTPAFFTQLTHLRQRRKATGEPPVNHPDGGNVQGGNLRGSNGDDAVDPANLISQSHGDLHAFLLVLGIGVAVSAVAGYTSLFARHPFALFYAYMMFATWYGDRRIGLAALLLSLLACAIIVPRFSSLPAEALIFLVASVVQLWLVGTLRAAYASLQRVRAAQQVSDQQLRAIVTYAPILFFTLNREGACTFLSSGGSAEPHSTGERPVGRTVSALFPQSQEQSIRAHFLRALGGEAHSSREIRDGKAYDVRWVPLREATGAISGVLGVAIDVSDQERARAEALQLARVRSDFLAAVSHELRTPLTVVLGFAQLLHSRWSDLSESRRFHGIEQIVTAAERQRRLVLDLLLASNIEASPFVLETQPMDLVACLEFAAATVRADYGGQPIRLLGASRPSVSVDPDRVPGVLLHLLDNAAKHSPAGASIDISWEIDGAQVAVRMRDYGPGIPASAQAQLFTRFGRVPGSPSKGGKTGTGLGLYVSREVVRAMGGDLMLDFTSSEGSTFRLLLPLSFTPALPS
jgi:PAS domain S-box-containing protein